MQRKKFDEIYQALRKGRDCPDVKPPSEKGKRLKSIFAEATEKQALKLK